MKPGILVISHGSREREWVRLVDEAVQAAASSKALQHCHVESSFLEIVEGRLIQDGIDRLVKQGVTELYVLPLFVSSGSTHVDEIAQAFGLPPAAHLSGGLDPFDVQANVHMGMPIDDDPIIAQLMLRNLRELSSDPAQEALLLIGHGSKEAVFYERWDTALRGLAEQMRAEGGFARAGTAMLLPNQAAAVLSEMQQNQPDEAIIVTAVFLSEGYFTKQVIPSRLKGLQYGYNGKALLPSREVEQWMARQMAAWLEQLEVNNNDN